MRVLFRGRMRKVVEKELRKLKSKFIVSEYVPKCLNKENLIFYGYYKNKDGLTSCIATYENGKKLISFGRRIKTADLFEAEKFFQIDSYETYSSGLGTGVFYVREIEPNF